MFHSSAYLQFLNNTSQHKLHIITRYFKCVIWVANLCSTCVYVYLITQLNVINFASFTLWPTLSALVNYHLLKSVQCAEAIMVGSMYETAEGSSIEIGCDGDSLTVNGIKMVLKKDIVATNGVIHLIDQMLIPNSGTNTFWSCLNRLASSA